MPLQTQKLKSTNSSREQPLLFHTPLGFPLQPERWIYIDWKPFVQLFLLLSVITVTSLLQHAELFRIVFALQAFHTESSNRFPLLQYIYYLKGILVTERKHKLNYHGSNSVLESLNLIGVGSLNIFGRKPLDVTIVYLIT